MRRWLKAVNGGLHIPCQWPMSCSLVLVLYVPAASGGNSNVELAVPEAGCLIPSQPGIDQCMSLKAWGLICSASNLFLAMTFPPPGKGPRSSHGADVLLLEESARPSEDGPGPATQGTGKGERPPETTPGRAEVDKAILREAASGTSTESSRFVCCVSAGTDVVQASARSELVHEHADPDPESFRRPFSARPQVLNFENIFSIGLRSGEYGGR